MGRLNLTLDRGTESRLERHARLSGKPRAALARELLSEGLDRREEDARRQRLAADYAAGRKDASALLSDLERAQLELLEEG